jgi:hypothetical protein
MDPIRKRKTMPDLPRAALEEAIELPDRTDESESVYHEEEDGTHHEECEGRFSARE